MHQNGWVRLPITGSLGRPTTQPWSWLQARFVLAVSLVSCVDASDAGLQQSAGERDQNRVAVLIQEMSIGDGVAAAPREYQFASIAALLVARDGRIWVADGGESGGMGRETPMLRQYDPDGNFLRQVGRDGSGPGEYRQPEGLALLADDRVALRDLGLPNRITLFGPDGALDTTWTLKTGHYWTSRASLALQVDTGGVLWLPFNPRPRANVISRPAFLRLRPDGTVLDTVPLPPVPEVQRDVVKITRTTPSGGVFSRGFTVPYQAWGRWTWSPFGNFAVTRTDQYSIEVLPPPGASPSDPGTTNVRAAPSRIVTRDLDAIPVPQDERRAARQRLTDEVHAFEGGRSIRIPEIPVRKPPIKGIRFSEDGQLLVLVSMPSRLEGKEWVESNAYDVFDDDALFTGRLVLPDSFRLFVMREDHIWGVFRGPEGVESVRRYRIVWP